MNINLFVPEKVNFEQIVHPVPETEKPKKRKKHKSKTKDFNKINIKSRAVFVLIIAALIFTISVVIRVVREDANGETTASAIDIIAGLAESVAGIVLGLSIGNMSLDFFSYADYMKERIKSVVIEKDFLKTISNKEKRRIIDELESSLYFNDKPIQEDSLYNNIKNKIIPLLEKEHYEKFFTHIDCEIKDGKIYKTISNKIVLNADYDGQAYELPFAIYFDKKDINDNETTYDIVEVKVNGKPIDIPKEQVVGKDNPNQKEQKLFYLDRTLELKKGINEICYISTSIVNTNDNMYTRTVSVPCKNCVIEMYLKNSNEYEIKGQGFAIDKEKTVDVKYYDNGCRIEFGDWIIPGDGCIFYIDKKNT